MNILILGSGGREHVMASKIGKSTLCSKLFIAPGNAGTSQCGTNVPLNPLDFGALSEFCVNNHIDMLVPGNEDPLVAGVTDYFKQHPELQHIHVAGPDKAGARLEGSKDFSKILMQKYGIPTAAYVTIDKSNIEEGYRFLHTMKPPYVLKADGLAAGKGVVIEHDLERAKAELKDMLNGKFGKSSEKVVIEEFLQGIELSCFVLCDGEHYVMLPEAKDYKRIGEGDNGLNTGGMGAISPVPFADAEFLSRVEQEVVIPTINGLRSEGIVYKGFLFIGLMNVHGAPKVIEYNCRMGDPETEVVLHRLENDLAELLLSACKGELKQQKLKVNPQSAVTVFLVSGGYPEQYATGYEITGISNVSGSTLYHAGTREEQGKITTSGGRVIAITSLGNNMQEALQRSMENASKIHFSDKYYRTDIGKDLLQYYEQI